MGETLAGVCRPLQLCTHSMWGPHWLPLPGSVSPVGQADTQPEGSSSRRKKHPQARSYRLWSRPDGPGFSQRKYCPWHPASRCLSKPRTATLQPADGLGGGSPPAPCPYPSISSFSSHLPWGAALFFSQGPTERKLGQSRLRQPCSRSNLSKRQFKRLDSVGVAGDAPKPEWLQCLQKDFLSHLHPHCLLFPEYEMHGFRKPVLTCEITFRAAINIPGGRVTLW